MAAGLGRSALADLVGGRLDSRNRVGAGRRPVAGGGRRRPGGGLHGRRLAAATCRWATPRAWAKASFPRRAWRACLRLWRPPLPEMRLHLNVGRIANRNEDEGYGWGKAGSSPGRPATRPRPAGGNGGNDHDATARPSNSGAATALWLEYSRDRFPDRPQVVQEGAVQRCRRRAALGPDRGLGRARIVPRLAGPRRRGHGLVSGVPRLDDVRGGLAPVRRGGRDRDGDGVVDRRDRCPGRGRGPRRFPGRRRLPRSRQRRRRHPRRAWTWPRTSRRTSTVSRTTTAARTTTTTATGSPTAGTCAPQSPRISTGARTTTAVRTMSWTRTSTAWTIAGPLPRTGRGPRRLRRRRRVSGGGQRPGRDRGRPRRVPRTARELQRRRGPGRLPGLTVVAAPGSVTPPRMSSGWTASE